MSSEDQEPNDFEPGHTWDVEGHSAQRLPENLAEITALKAEIERLEALAVQSTADVEIAQQRCDREVEDARNFAVAKFAFDILTVADNLQRAVATSDVSALEAGVAEPVLDGVRATERVLVAVLNKFKITRLAALGTAFDPAFQEAVLEDKASSLVPGTVVQVVEDGYMINGRLLRPARVVIAAVGGDREHRSV